MRWRFVWAVGCMAWGCGPPWDSSGAAPFELFALSERELTEVGTADRFLLRGAPIQSTLDVWLLEGELSSTSSKRLVPGTLASGEYARTGSAV